MTLAPSLPQAAAVLAALNAVDNVTAYDSVAPADAVAPYVVLYAGLSGFDPFTDGTLADRFKDTTVDFQTTSIGETAEQARWMGDKVHAALLAATPAVSGRVSHPIWLEEIPQPVRRDDSLAVPLFYAVARWKFRTST